MKKILVIDDIVENLESAKIAVNLWNEENEEKVDAIYVSDAKHALAEINDSHFDLILSDVFFDYDGDYTPQEIRQQIIDIVGPYGAINPSKLEDHGRQQFFERDFAGASKGWTENGQTPPMGVFVAIKALAKDMNQIIVFNSSLYHHNNAAEPINTWRRINHQMNIIFFDENNNSFTRMLVSKGIDYETAVMGCNDTRLDLKGKDWRGALSEGMEILKNMGKE